MQYTHTMEYYSAIKPNELSFVQMNKNKWKEKNWTHYDVNEFLKNIMLVTKNTYCMILAVKKYPKSASI